MTPIQTIVNLLRLQRIDHTYFHAVINERAVALVWDAASFEKRIASYENNFNELLYFARKLSPAKLKKLLPYPYDNQDIDTVTFVEAFSKFINCSDNREPYCLVQIENFFSSMYSSPSLIRKAKKYLEYLRHRT